MSMKFSSNTTVNTYNLDTSMRVVVYNSHVYHTPSWNKMVSIRFGRKMYEPRFNARTGELLKKADSERRSIRRAKCTLVDLAKKNAFEYFGTLTLDSAKHDVANISSCVEKMRKALKNYTELAKLDGKDFKYIVVPEFGSRQGRLHFHFLMKGLRETDLFRNQYGKLDFKYFKERFGFVQITRIGNNRSDLERVAVYCGKYMTKDNVQVGTHRYFRSTGLIKPECKVYRHINFARFVTKFLEEYPERCYYDGRCKCYDIPKYLYEKMLSNIASEYLNLCRHHRVGYKGNADIGRLKDYGLE